MKTGRPPKFGKRGKLIGVTIPLEDYEMIKEQHLDPGKILHNALNLLEDKPTVIEDTLTAALLSKWGSFLDHVKTLTGSRSCPFGKLNDAALDKSSAWWENEGVKITNRQLRQKWSYLCHANQKLKH